MSEPVERLGKAIWPFLAVTNFGFFIAQLRAGHMWFWFTDLLLSGLFSAISMDAYLRSEPAGKESE